MLPKSTYFAKRGNAAVVCVPCCRYACVAAPRALLTRHLARWLSVERSARLLAYAMRSSGVSRYVIVGAFVPFRHAPSLADSAPGRLCDKSLCRRAASRQGVNELPARRVPREISRVSPERARRAPRRARAAMAPSQARHGRQGPGRELLGARWRQATTQLLGSAGGATNSSWVSAPTPTTRCRLTASASACSLFLRAVANDSDAYERGYVNEAAEF